MSLWDSITSGAKRAGDAAAIQAKKGKLKADIVLLNREITNRQRSFGVALYDHVSPMSSSADFYAAEDQLTKLLRPPLINAQKEIQALAGKRVKLKESLAQAETNRVAAFSSKAETAGQKFMNFGKAGAMHGGETKIKGEIALLDRSIKGYKQTFGLELFRLLADAEDNTGFLPTDRQVRSIYDVCRGDIQRLQAKIKNKDEEIVALGGKSTQGVGFGSSEAGGNMSSFFGPSTPSSTSGSGSIKPYSPPQAFG